MSRATTQSSSQWPNDFNMEAWAKAWLQERGQHLAWLLINIDEPVRRDDFVYIIAIADYPFPQASKMTMWGLCLIGERLTRRTAESLNIALRSITNLYGLDTEEAFAFLMHRYLNAIEILRAVDRQPSLLLESEWIPFGHTGQDLWAHWPSLLQHPLWDLKLLLNWWYRWKRLGTSARHPLPSAQGRLWNLTIPKLLMSYEQLQSLSEDSELKNRTSTWVEDPSVFRQFGNFRVVFWREQRITFTTAQAQCLKVLYEAKQAGQPALPEDYIFTLMGRTTGTVRSIFRSKERKGQHIIGTLLKKEAPGYWSLNI